MGTVYYRDKSGLLHEFIIAGHKPTPTEQERINTILEGGTYVPASQPVDSMANTPLADLFVALLPTLLFFGLIWLFGRISHSSRVLKKSLASAWVA